MANTSYKKSVNMTYKALYSYILNTNVRSIPGWIGIFISLASLVALIIGWDTYATNRKVAYIILALAFTVINPLLLAFKAFKQYKLNPAYKKPLTYEFTDEGITISQGETTQNITWANICRIMKTSSMVAIYTNKIYAFVIPLSELGEDKSKILAKVVSFTADYRPSVSGSLKQYKTGKGFK